jgi:hypothetical protein
MNQKKRTPPPVVISDDDIEQKRETRPQSCGNCSSFVPPTVGVWGKCHYGPGPTAVTVLMSPESVGASPENGPIPITYANWPPTQAESFCTAGWQPKHVH